MARERKGDERGEGEEREKGTRGRKEEIREDRYRKRERLRRCCCHKCELMDAKNGIGHTT